MTVNKAGHKPSKFSLMDFWHSCLQDVRVGSRSLRKRPALTAFLLLTIAIGTGTNIALFSVINAALLEPLPYPEPNQLLTVWSVYTKGGGQRVPVSPAELAEVIQRSRLLKNIGGVYVNNLSVIGVGDPEQIKVARATEGFLPSLGVSPQLGRYFLPEEEGHGINVIILSNGLWRRKFAADPEIIGKPIRTASGTVTVVGVLPPNFDLVFPPDAFIPPDIQAWVPFPTPVSVGAQEPSMLRLVARMHPGARVPQVQSELKGIASEIRSKHPEFATQGLEIQAAALHADAVRDARPALLVLFSGTVLVLLIACANIASLLLTRASERVREITMRTALGASRARTVRQLLTESVLLSVFGVALGTLFAGFGVQVLPRILPLATPRLNQVSLNGTTLMFSLLLCLVTGLVFGLAPALGATRVDLAEAMKEGGRTTGGARHGLRKALVLGEVALAFVLLLGAGLMLRTFMHLLRVDPGFDAQHVLTFAITLPQNRYQDDAKRTAFLRPLEAELANVPGVEAVGMSSHLPFDSANWSDNFWPEGATLEEQTSRDADYRTISAGFLSAIHAHLVAGRTFTETDDVDHPLAIIIDDLLAQQVWPGQDPIGKKLNVGLIRNGEFPRGWAQVVGVVRHLNYQSLTQTGRPQIYESYLQSQRAQFQTFFTLRTSAIPESLLAPASRVVHKMDKDIAVAKVRRLDTYLDQAQAKTRSTTLLSGYLGVVALMLACLGIYGVTSYSVSQSTAEIGVRMALGAQRTDIIQMVLRQCLLFVGLGIVAGMIVSIAVGPVISGLLFQVKSTDLVTFFSVAVLLIAVGFLACFVPATRASRLDPLTALRTE